MEVTTEEELWLVSRTEGWVLMFPVWGYSSTGRIRVKHVAGGPVTVIPAGTSVEIVWDQRWDIRWDQRGDT